MFMKMFFAFAFGLTLLLQIQAHAIITPALGVNGTATRNDVQRPSTNAMCGNTNINNTLTSSTPIIAKSDGTFMANVTNFNGGQDGSRQVTAAVDTTATGKNFTTATVTQNGDLAPTSVGSQIITVQLPSGAKCSGGPSSDLCLVSFKTAAGFGNCAVVQQASTTNGSGSSKQCKTASQSTSANSRRDVIDVRATGTRAAHAFRRMLRERK
ncbi:hypothetical protein BC835DRAFT_246534 [Cytidiella melzeri]|nr:hypothetical protein BC835DRAFT_246534 [Cytidiella melzeri]